MNVTLYGVRGSLATPGPSTARYGGNTSCVRLTGPDGSVVVLDAGTGIRPLALELPEGLTRVDVLLTHLHMDHILGLGFFAPLYDPRMEVHIWGPASATLSLEARLRRYLSPPLFPVMLRDVPCRLELHHVVRGPVPIGPFRVTAGRVCHPGPTVGYRIETAAPRWRICPTTSPRSGLADSHSSRNGPRASTWPAASICCSTTRSTRARSIRDHVGWGHSTIHDALAFAELAGVKHLVPFHHDPGREDAALEAAIEAAVRDVLPEFPVTPAAEGARFDLG